MVQSLPSGVVTYLMTDVVGSTALWRDSPRAAEVMARQTELIGAAVARRGGVRPADQGEGDSTLSVFAHPRDALAAACEAQRALVAECWPDGATVRVRMALHSGDAELVGETNYGGLALIRCARLRALAAGGQVLVSSTTTALAGEQLPDGATLVELDAVTVADFAAPERVRQLCHPDLPGGTTVLRGSLTRLPVWPTPLIGRERERRELAEILTQQRIVTVTGAGGSGKTRLALAVAEDLRDHFADGVVWVELARLSDPAQVVGAVIAACGEAELAGVDPLALLVRRLAEQDRLLVLDNCEHLLAVCAELVDRVIRGAPRIRVLTTSREPLGVVGETSWRVPSLSLPADDERDPGRLTESDAAQLFIARARAVRRDFAIDAATASIVARICRRLDGVPLALELAAARARALSLERLADGLDDRFRLLTGGARTVVERQRTLLASVEWSHDLLDEEERVLLRRIAVFAAPFELDAAEAVAVDEDIDAGSVLDLLTRLVDKNLVMHAEDRYRLLETIRQFAVARAGEAGELELLRERHLAWFRLRARGWRLDREFGAPPVLAQVAVEVPDLIAAAEWCAAHEHQLPPEMLHALAQHWGETTRLVEARTVGARLLPMLRSEPCAWLGAVAVLSTTLSIAGDFSWRAPAEAALGSDGDRLDPTTRAWLDIGFNMFARGDIDRVERAIEIGHTSANAYLETCARINLTIHLMLLGDMAGIRPHFAWIERNVPPNTWARAFMSPVDIGLAMWDADFARIKRVMKESTRQRPPVLRQLADVALYEVAAVELADVLERVESLRDVGVMRGTIDSCRASLALLADDLPTAAAHLDRAIVQAPIPFFGLFFELRRAQVALALGDVDDAARRTAALDAALAGVPVVVIRGYVDILTAHIARIRGDASAAEALARRALGAARQHEILLVINVALETAALLAADRDELDFAARLVGAAAAFRERTGFRWREHHCRASFDALVARLPKDAVADGAQLSITEAADYALRGQGERGRPGHGWASLTPTEQRVVDLVAAGLPNAAIAKKLFVSLATVKTHLVHVYAKLGLESRAELIAAATAKRFDSAS